MVRKSTAKVVTIGGGTGSSTLLRGLKQFTEYITAIVTVADDGGGSGVLREELGMLPPGDARNCLFALANREPTLTQVFDYRFKEGSLKGQSLGNLFVAAMTDIYGSFELGLKEAGDILAITGQVMPMTLEDVKLCATLKDGSTVKGESILPEEVKKRKTAIETVYLEPNVAKTLPCTLEAIQEADLILLGPGSLYTSLVPNLLVEELSQAVANSKGQVFYICNLMTQPGETDGFSVRDHFIALGKYVDTKVIDAIFVNNELAPKEVLERYIHGGEQTPVCMTKEDYAFFEERKIKVVEGPFMETQRKYLRHDALTLCEYIFDNYTQVYHG